MERVGGTMEKRCGSLCSGSNACKVPRRCLVRHECSLATTTRTCMKYPVSTYEPPSSPHWSDVTTRHAVVLPKRAAELLDTATHWAFFLTFLCIYDSLAIHRLARDIEGFRKSILGYAPCGCPRGRGCQLHRASVVVQTLVTPR